jgi:phosphoribosylanthranilate isomerase
VTRVEDAVLAVELGADYLGLNFHLPSPRCLTVERARAITAAVRGRVGVVGVFVNAGAERIREIDRAVGLDLVQLHGDEGPAQVAELGSRAIKVFRRGAAPGPDELATYAGAWGFLFDVPHAGAYGGTGVSWSYEAVAGLATDRPFFIAGGIRPGNARAALGASRAWGLDVCSGVESRPGIKDGKLLKRLFLEVGDG